MSNDLPDFLSDAPSTAPEAPQSAPEAAAPAPAPEAAAEGPVRGPDGRFAPAERTPEAAPAATPEPAPAGPAASADPQHHVPLPVALDWRDRMTAAEKEARELRAWREQQEAAARRQPPPDRDADPLAYEAYREQQLASQLYAQGLAFSRSLAEVKHGEDVVSKAFDWGVQRCDQDPFFNEKVRASPDPVGFVVGEWKREQLLTRVSPEDLDAFQAWKAQQAAAPASPASPAAPPARPAAPRPSLAGGPSAGATSGAVPLDGEATFEAMFQK